MKYLGIFLLILFLSFLQTSFFDFNFVLLLILILSFILEEKLVFFFAFISGVILDLAAGEVLGSASLGFLIPALLVVLGHRQFSFQNPLAIFALSAFSSVLFSLLAGRPVNLFEAAFLGILLLGLRFFAPFLFKKKDEKQLRLEL